MDEFGSVYTNEKWKKDKKGGVKGRKPEGLNT
jgi:hypothetical protein